MKKAVRAPDLVRVFKTRCFFCDHVESAHMFLQNPRLDVDTDDYDNVKHGPCDAPDCTCPFFRWYWWVRDEHGFDWVKQDGPTAPRNVWRGAFLRYSDEGTEVHRSDWYLAYFTKSVIGWPRGRVGDLRRLWDGSIYGQEANRAKGGPQ